MRKYSISQSILPECAGVNFKLQTFVRNGPRQGRLSVIRCPHTIYVSILSTTSKSHFFRMEPVAQRLGTCSTCCMCKSASLLQMDCCRMPQHTCHDSKGWRDGVRAKFNGPRVSFGTLISLCPLMLVLMTASRRICLWLTSSYTSSCATIPHRREPRSVRQGSWQFPRL